MSRSFQEKSLWLMFVSLIVAFGIYFARAVPGHGVDVSPSQVALFVLAVVLLVLMQAAGHAMIAIMDRRVETDERDRLIALVGSRNGSVVLATGTFLALCLAVFTKGNFILTHVLLAFWVLAQLVEIGSQLYCYRRGA